MIFRLDASDYFARLDDAGRADINAWSRKHVPDPGHCAIHRIDVLSEGTSAVWTLVGYTGDLTVRGVTAYDTGHADDRALLLHRRVIDAVPPAHLLHHFQPHKEPVLIVIPEEAR